MKLLASSIVAVALNVMVAAAVSALPVNLVPNGTFEAGNVQFTSDYGYSPGGNSTEWQYTVLTNPYPWNGSFVSIGDHTTGTGLMMVANGSPVSGAAVWSSQSFAVAAGDYFFEAFVSNVCCSTFTYGPGSESILEFSLSLDGNAPISLGTKTTSLALTGTWEGLSTQFYVPSASNIVLSLINRNTNAGGNDFVVDDIYFGSESIVLPPTNAPAPGALALLALGVLGLGAARRRRTN